MQSANSRKHSERETAIKQIEHIFSLSNNGSLNVQQLSVCSLSPCVHSRICTSLSTSAPAVFFSIWMIRVYPTANSTDYIRSQTTRALIHLFYPHQWKAFLGSGSHRVGGVFDGVWYVLQCLYVCVCVCVCVCVSTPVFVSEQLCVFHHNHCERRKRLCDQQKCQMTAEANKGGSLESRGVDWKGREVGETKKNCNGKWERGEGEERERSSSFLAALQASHPRTVNLLFEILFNIDYWQARCMRSLRREWRRNFKRSLLFAASFSAHNQSSCNINMRIFLFIYFFVCFFKNFFHHMFP